jgi:hypothetical protein
LKNNTRYILPLIILISSCEFFQVKKEVPEGTAQEQAIARAHDTFLYKEDISSIIPNGMSPADSAERVNRYIDSWARKQLLIKEATKNIEFDEAEIERKILDYRYSLMGYEYQSYYVNEKLLSEVTDAEIEVYYTEHIDNFTLKQNIIRGKFINLPVGAPSTVDVKKLIHSNKESDLETLKTYCLSFATSYQLNDSAWINFEELVRSTPLAQLDNKVQFLKTKKYTELADSTNLYYLSISAYKMSDELSPMEFVKDQIKNIIINKRKIALARQLEEEVYEKAVRNNEIEIYEN